MTASIEEQKLELRLLMKEFYGRSDPALDIERWFTEPVAALAGATPDALIEAGRGHDVYEAIVAWAGDTK